MVNRRIAIIPARGGSKRIPEKNIVPFLGKPMIAWTIGAAVRSGCFERVLVSTDDEKIAAVSREWGADVPFLRDDAADDYSPVSVATWAALKQAEEYWGEDYDTVVQMMANCPLRDEEHIREALAAFEENGRSFQISCFPFGWMNPWWAAELDEAGRPSRLFPEAAVQRSQDLPALYCPTGATWVARVADFAQEKTFYGTGFCFQPMSWEAAVDIDDHDDLKFAHALAYSKDLTG